MSIEARAPSAGSGMSTSSRRLDRADFNAPTLRVARALLGKYIVRRTPEREITAMIAEVEAYKGPRDLASHAARGRRTARVEPLYADGGTIYVYFCYGMHWLLNFSTLGAELPEAVLIRGVFTDEPTPKAILGPARVTKYLEIDKRLDGGDAVTSLELWVEDRGVRIASRRIQTGPRIGIDYAGAYWAARPWRFWLEPPGKARSRG